MKSPERWNHIGCIIEKIQTISPRELSVLEQLETLLVLPSTGLLMVTVVRYLSFLLISTIGAGVTVHMMEPFFEYLCIPALLQRSILLEGEGILHSILVGQFIEGEMDSEQSFGLLSARIFDPLAAIPPYIFSFLSLLKTSGISRTSVLADNVMHRVGLHGFSIIPMILGLRCNVPAALATGTFLLACFLPSKND